MERSPELEAVIKRMWHAWANQDVDAVTNMMVPDPGYRMILGADDEWFQGDVARYITERSRVLGVERVEFDRVEAYEHGDVGWAATEVTIIRAEGETTRARNTVVFLLDGGVWRAAQLHTSVGVSRTEEFGVAINEGLEALLTALDADSHRLLDRVSSGAGTVTLVFTDIEGSTQLAETIGDATWLEILTDHFTAVRTATETVGGTVVKTLGDGAMLAFPTATAGIEASVAIQRGATKASVPLRVGVHSGEAVHVGDDYLGIAVNKAARIASAASGGEILLSSTAFELAGSHGYEWGEERLAELKGLAGSHRLIPLLWEGTRSG
jgi:class 3 adenylate cyclase